MNATSLVQRRNAPAATAATPILQRLAAGHGLGEQAEILEAALLPAAAFVLDPLPNDGPIVCRRLLRREAPSEAPSSRLPVGCSRFGGGPDLPAGFDWPRHKGRPLDFLLQIDCADLASLTLSLPLPATGVLTFFCDQHDQHWGRHPENRSAYAIVHFPQREGLAPVRPPDRRFALPHAKLRFRQALTLPSPGSRAYDRLESQLQARLDGRLDEAAYRALRQSLFHADAARPDLPWHCLGGHATHIHDDLPLEAQLVMHGVDCTDGLPRRQPQDRRLYAGRDDWRLLLQIDEDPRTGPLWRGCGVLSFWARPADLARGDFAQVYLTTQAP